MRSFTIKQFIQSKYNIC